jgi:DNA-binding transcriptional LysR family regulator
MEFDNIETIKRALEINAGVAILPEPTVSREVAAGTLVAIPIQGEELVRPLGIIFRRGKELSVTVRRFIDLLRSEIDERMTEDPALVPRASIAPPTGKARTEALVAAGM